MYDYLVKIILVGPSGSGKSCLLHRFIKSEWRSLTSQTIGVEFATKIVRVGTGSRRQRIKLQLWDTAGTERFRGISRSYYRGAAGAILVYDVANKKSFDQIGPFLKDARALGSPNLTIVLAGNKVDIADMDQGGGSSSSSQQQRGQNIPQRGWETSSAADMATSYASTATSQTTILNSSVPSEPDTRLKSQPSIASGPGFGAPQSVTQAPEGRAVLLSQASTWASAASIPVAAEVSAYSGEGVDDLFQRLAAMILTKIELGEIDPNDPANGIHYGDAPGWRMADDGAGSVRSGQGGWGLWKRRGGGRNRPGTSTGLREWEEVFRVDRRRGGCC